MSKPDSGPASNWWMFHRDLEHTSRVPDVPLETGITSLNEFWHRTFPEALQTTHPILGDDDLLL